MKDTKYRHCVDEKKGNCVYLKYNEYGIPCCGIDWVIGVEYYGCIPAETKKLLKARRDQN